ncbi:ketopantoate reductase PanE/ApbA C terminal-domain-containing protein [Podospora australis]|uniref:2-dehydropantoate 2-reductase n=1 Tax=Podospora australis TaxID=1536484 RepID=A0AAN6X459_9PEZI|nr:ketopantoate reductase PanE/ApbA C terminal-domain-containing protein [Podospora australis]
MKKSVTKATFSTLSFLRSGAATKQWSLDQELRKRDSQIHILGVGNLGKYLGYGLAQSHARLPYPLVRLLFHRPSKLESFVNSGSCLIRRDKYGVETKSPEVEAELLATPDKGEEAESAYQYPIKYMIVTTKAGKTAAAIDLVKHRLTHESTVLLVQNGMGAIDEVKNKMFPNPNIRPTFLSGLCYAGINSNPSRGKNEKDQYGWPFFHAGRGRLDIENTKNPESQWLLRRLIQAGYLLETELVEPAHILTEQLKKLAINAVVNPLTTTFDCANGELLSSPARMALVEAVTKEIAEIYQNMLPGPGPELHDYKNLLPIVHQTIRTTSRNFSSMYQDVAAGRKTEIEYINGYLVREAEKFNVKAPYQKKLVSLVNNREIISDRDIEETFKF